MEVKKGLCHWCRESTDQDNNFCSIECFHDLHHAEQLLNCLEGHLKQLNRQMEGLTHQLQNFSRFVEAEPTGNAVTIHNSEMLLRDRNNLAVRISELERDLRTVQARLS